MAAGVRVGLPWISVGSWLGEGEGSGGTNEDAKELVLDVYT